MFRFNVFNELNSYLGLLSSRIFSHRSHSLFVLDHAYFSLSPCSYFTLHTLIRPLFFFPSYLLSNIPTYHVLLLNLPPVFYGNINRLLCIVMFYSLYAVTVAAAVPHFPAGLLIVSPYCENKYAVCATGRMFTSNTPSSHPRRV